MRSFSGGMWYLGAGHRVEGDHESQKLRGRLRWSSVEQASGGPQHASDISMDSGYKGWYREGGPGSSGMRKRTPRATCLKAQ